MAETDCEEKTRLLAHLESSTKDSKARIEDLQTRLDQQKHFFDQQQSEANRAFEDLHAELQMVYRDIQDCYGKDTLAFVRENSKLKRRIRDLERFRESALHHHRSNMSTQSTVKSSFAELTAQVSTLINERKELVQHISELGKEIESLRETNTWILKSQKSLQSLEENRRLMKSKPKLDDILSSVDTPDNALIDAYKSSLKSRDERILALESRMTEIVSKNVSALVPNLASTGKIEQELVEQLLADQSQNQEALTRMKRKHEQAIKDAHDKIQEKDQQIEQLNVHSALLESELAEIKYKAISQRLSSKAPQGTTGADSQGLSMRHDLVKMMQQLQVQKVGALHVLQQSLDRLCAIKASRLVPEPVSSSPRRISANAPASKVLLPPSLMPGSPKSNPSLLPKNVSSPVGATKNYPRFPGSPQTASTKRPVERLEDVPRGISRGSSVTSSSSFSPRRRPSSTVSHVSVADELRALNLAAKSPYRDPSLRRSKPDLSKVERNSSIKLLRDAAESFKKSQAPILPVNTPQTSLDMDL